MKSSFGILVCCLNQRSANFLFSINLALTKALSCHSSDTLFLSFPPFFLSLVPIFFFSQIEEVFFFSYSSFMSSSIPIFKCFYSFPSSPLYSDQSLTQPRSSATKEGFHGLLTLGSFCDNPQTLHANKTRSLRFRGSVRSF